MISKIKEALICLRARRVTFRYPLEPMPAPARFRGRPTIDGAKCIGCGACAAVCPPRLISVSGEGMMRTVELNFSRCTYCARCQEVCPVGAMQCTTEFETAAADRANYSVKVELEAVPCQNCGTPFITERMQKKLLAEMSPSWMESRRELPEWLFLCQNCRVEKTGMTMGRNIKNG